MVPEAGTIKELPNLVSFFVLIFAIQKHIAQKMVIKINFILLKIFIKRQFKRLIKQKIGKMKEREKNLHNLPFNLQLRPSQHHSKHSKDYYSQLWASNEN